MRPYRQTVFSFFALVAAMTSTTDVLANESSELRAPIRIEIRPGVPPRIRAPYPPPIYQPAPHPRPPRPYPPAPPRPYPPAPPRPYPPRPYPPAPPRPYPPAPPRPGPSVRYFEAPIYQNYYGRAFFDVRQLLDINSQFDGQRLAYVKVRASSQGRWAQAEMLINGYVQGNSVQIGGGTRDYFFYPYSQSEFGYGIGSLTLEFSGDVYIETIGVSLN